MIEIVAGFLCFLLFHTFSSLFSFFLNHPSSFFLNPSFLFLSYWILTWFFLLRCILGWSSSNSSFCWLFFFFFALLLFWVSFSSNWVCFPNLWIFSLIYYFWLLLCLGSFLLIGCFFVKVVDHSVSFLSFLSGFGVLGSISFLYVVLVSIFSGIDSFDGMRGCTFC